MDVDFKRENKSFIGVNGKRSREDLMVKTTERGGQNQKRERFCRVFRKGRRVGHSAK